MSTTLPRQDEVPDAAPPPEHAVRQDVAVIRGIAQLLRRRAERDPARELPRGLRYLDAIDAAVGRIVRVLEGWRGQRARR